MYLVLNSNDLIAEICERPIFVRRQTNGVVISCAESEADAIYLPDTDSYYPAKKTADSKNTYRLEEVENIPEGVSVLCWKYSEGEFIELDTLSYDDLGPELLLRQVLLIVNALLGDVDNKLLEVTSSSMLRRAMQMYVQSSVSEEEQMMEVADLYPSWDELVASKKQYPAKTVFKWGVDSFGDTQLWRFVQDYVPTTLYTPDQDPTHYTKIGVTEEGYLEWKRPLGSTDAYDIGDIVYHNGKLWICTLGDAAGKNTWEPGVYGWEEYTEETQEGDVTE